MTKEQVFEKIDDIYSEHDGGVIYLSEERMNHIKEIIQQAINYTRCCTELCEHEDSEISDDGKYWQCTKCKERQS